MIRSPWTASFFVLALGLDAAAQNVRAVVIFNGEPDAAAVMDTGGTIVRVSPASRLVVALLSADGMGRLARNPDVAAVHEDGLSGLPDAEVAGIRLAAGRPLPAQPPQTLRWGVDRIDADLVWSVSRGAGVKIAIIDTGIMPDHLDFMDAGGASRVVMGANFVNPHRPPKDDHGHGTHVAGIAGASDNAIGVVGVAPECALVAVKVLDRRGSGWDSDIVAGIDWAADNGAQVINLSLAGPADNPALAASVSRAWSRGVVICAGAGNSGATSPTLYPAAYPEAIAVAATDSADGIAWFSSRGSYVDVAAPGASILSTYHDGGYATGNGTSMACPHAAGAAALAIAAGETSNVNVRARLEGTADDVNAYYAPGSDVEIGNGLIDAQEAVTGFQTLP